MATRPYRLRVYVYQAQGIPVADADGGSDPFVVVRCGRSVSRTQVCGGTTSPAWFAEVPLEVQLPVCSRPDMMSFGAMVHNAKHVDRARRQLAAALHKKALEREAEREAARREAGLKGEDLPLLGDTETTVGGGLQEEGFEDDYIYDDPLDDDDGAHGDKDGGGGEDAEHGAHKFTDGDVLSWAMPNIVLTVYDKGAMGDEPLCVATVAASQRLFNDKYSEGATDADGQIFRSVKLKWCACVHALCVHVPDVRHARCCGFV